MQVVNSGARVQIPPSPLLFEEYELFNFFLKKLLTDATRCDNLMKLSLPRGKQRLEKEIKKLLTNEFESDIVNKLSLERNNSRANKKHWLGSCEATSMATRSVDYVH